MSPLPASASNLAPDTGRNSKPKQISRYIASALRERAFRASLVLGLKRLRDVVPDDWAAPDSRLADEARAFATELCSPVLVAHSERTYCFGAILAARDGLKMDRELLYIACLLHDLGLSEVHRDEPGSFEWVSAREARNFCSARGLSDAKADLVHDAVALHSSVGLANRREPEVAFVHYGAGLAVSFYPNLVPRRYSMSFAKKRLISSWQFLPFITNSLPIGIKCQQNNKVKSQRH